MKIRNRTGPWTLPWGTPVLTGRGDERIRGRATPWLREQRKSVSHVWSWPWMPEEDSLESKAGCQTVLKAQDLSRETALISCLTLRVSVHCLVRRNSKSKVKWPNLKQICDLRWGCWRKESISYQLRLWIPWPWWWLEVRWEVCSLGDQFFHLFYGMQWCWWISKQMKDDPE